MPCWPYVFFMNRNGWVTILIVCVNGIIVAGNDVVEIGKTKETFGYKVWNQGFWRVEVFVFPWVKTAQSKMRDCDVSARVR